MGYILFFILYILETFEYIEVKERNLYREVIQQTFDFVQQFLLILLSWSGQLKFEKC